MPKDQAQPTQIVKMAMVKKVIHYDSKTHSCIMMVQPADWQKAPLKVLGFSNTTPVEGQVLKVQGEIIREPWLNESGKPRVSDKGNELFNYVMPKAKIHDLGPATSLSGKVVKVFYSNEEHNNSISLVRPSGWKTPIKIHAPVAVKEGDFLNVTGYKDSTPWLGKDGKPVVGEDGKQRYNQEIRATEVRVRKQFKEYSGPITRIFAYNEQNGDAIVLMNPGFEGGRDVKAYVNLGEAPIEGAMLTISGFIAEEEQMKNGTPALDGNGRPFTNLVIQGVESYQTPKEENAQIKEPADAAPADWAAESEEDSGPSPN